MQAETREDHGKANALAWFQTIVELVRALKADDSEVPLHFDGETFDTIEDMREAAEERIRESALSVQVRSDWYSPGDPDDTQSKPTEFRVLLTTGGPALQLVGTLNEHGEPEEDIIALQSQDWGTPWTNVPARDLDEAAKLTDDETVANMLATFAAQFYFGDG